MQMNPQDQAELGKYTKVAQKIIYDPARMREFLKMLGSKEGAITAVQTVVAGIDKIRPVPPAIAPLLGVNVYMLIVDVAQEATGRKADPAIMKAVIEQIMQSVQSGEAPAPEAEPQGMLAQMQGEGPGADNTAMHEGEEPAATEMAEGSEEDNVMARLQRQGVPA